MSFFKLFDSCFHFPGAGLKELSESVPHSNNPSAQLGMDVQEEDPWGADPLQVWTQVSGEHPHPTPSQALKSSPSKNTGEHKAKKAPTANPTSKK